MSDPIGLDDDAIENAPVPWEPGYDEYVRQQRGRDLRDRLAASGVGARYLDVGWASVEEVEPFPMIRRIADSIVTDLLEPGYSLILVGPPGSGKTQAAMLLARATVQAGLSVEVVNLGRLAMAIRAGYDGGGGPSESEAVERMSQADLLVVDDFGAGQSNAGATEGKVLYQAAEARQNMRRATVLTTNLTPTAVVRELGQRVVNRLTPFDTLAFAHGRNFRAATASFPWRENQ